ncbi:hypothetical protein IID23_02300 [Patescibacteria group bacterium]|nr:hypothetical protein [Patescibacteria group bacterium]
MAVSTWQLFYGSTYTTHSFNVFIKNLNIDETITMLEFFENFRIDFTVTASGWTYQVQDGTSPAATFNGPENYNEQWITIGHSYNDVTKELIAYINGQSVGSSSVLDFSFDPQFFSVGPSGVSAGTEWQVDEMAFWKDVILDPANFEQLANMLP